MSPPSPFAVPAVPTRRSAGWRRRLAVLALLALAAPPAGAACLGEPDVLCLHDGRFRVHARWSKPGVGGGPGIAQPLTRDTGTFWFFDAENIELVVKVLDACAVNQRFWIFAAGLTNVGVSLTVEDTVRGTAWTAGNAAGRPFPPIQDTAALAGCGGEPSGGRVATAAWGPEILTTDVSLDLDTLHGAATVVFEAAGRRTAYLAVGGLSELAVRDALGPLPHALDGETLVVGLRPQTGAPEVTIDYRFTERRGPTGWMVSGSSYTWPYHCGNLFPCHPHPSDGARFSLAVGGAAAPGAVYPRTLPAEAPAYMLGLATGDYRHEPLGVTDGGTRVGVWYLAGRRAQALAGGLHLRAGFDWLEKTLGAYPFGPEVASVEVDWPPAAGVGAIEHHPFWHVERGAFDDPLIHLHEAAHGWFGNGVRLRCWEDFVLSEGAATYLAARAVEAAAGAAAGDEVWQRYRRELDAIPGGEAGSVWPPGCNEIDVESSRLLSLATYYRGAFFLREVEQAVGRAELDAALAAFTARHVGGAATMGDLIAAIESATGYDAAAAVTRWLRGAPAASTTAGR